MAWFACVGGPKAAWRPKGRWQATGHLKGSYAGADRDRMGMIELVDDGKFREEVLTGYFRA
jgi:hypothetical protein